MKARIAKILRHPAAQIAARMMLRERGTVTPVMNPIRDAKRRLRAMDHRTRGRVHARLHKLGDRLYPRPWKYNVAGRAAPLATFVDEYKSFQSRPEDS